MIIGRGLAWWARRRHQSRRGLGKAQKGNPDAKPAHATLAHVKPAHVTGNHPGVGPVSSLPKGRGRLDATRWGKYMGIYKTPQEKIPLLYGSLTP